MPINERPKTKIVYVITKSTWGGAGRYIYDLATSLPQNEYEVTVVCGGKGLLSERLTAKGIMCFDVPELERDIRFFAEFKVLGKLKNIFEALQPDIVHLNSSKIGGIGAVAAKRAHVPKVIFTAHGFAFNEPRGIVWKILTYLASWVTALLVDNLITISYREESQALAFPFVSSKKVRMVYVGIREEPTLSREEARKYIQGVNKKTPQANALWIGSIGELHKNKGHIYALQMCTILKQQKKDFFYFLIGEGEERAALENYIRENELAENVALLGPIPTPSSGSTLLKAFDLFLLPSTKEGLPYVLLEAALAEVPVISTYVGGIPEIVRHNETGLLAGEISGEVLAELVERVLYDSNIRKDYAVRLKDHVRSTFSFEKMFKETIAIYRD